MISDFFRLFLLRLMGIIFPVAVILISYIYVKTDDLRQDVLSDERVLIQSIYDQINYKFHSKLTDLLILHDSYELKEYISNPTEQKKKLTEEKFATILNVNKNYVHVRYLDLSGKEKLRVNFYQDKAVSVPIHKLQDKSDRDYFKISLKLGKHEVYISPLDLNRESGFIERPFRPVIRFIMKVNDQDGKESGLLILNYDSSNLLNTLTHYDNETSGKIIFLNTNGQWLYGNSNLEPWGFLFGMKEKFQDYFPKVWKKINAVNTGQTYLKDNVIFTYKVIKYPPFEFKNNLIEINPDFQQRWVIASELDMINDHLNRSEYHYLYIFFVFCLFGISSAVAWYWAKSIFKYKEEHAKINELSRVVEQSDEIVYITDIDGNITYVNNAFIEKTGFSREEVLGENPRLFKSGSHDIEFYDNLWQTILSGKPFESIVVNKRKDGSNYYEEKTINPIFDENKNIVQFVSTGRDISELEKLRKLHVNLEKLAYNDSLTDLPNRLSLMEKLEGAIAIANRTEKLIGIMFIDVDNFKEINDEYGHNVGDKLLQTIAVRLQNSIRGSDIAARLAGDEFVVIVTHINRIDLVNGIADNIVKSISAPYTILDREYDTTCSIGITIYPFGEEPASAELLIEQADKAMYKAKAKKGNNYAFYEKGM